MKHVLDMLDEALVLHKRTGTLLTEMSKELRGVPPPVEPPLAGTNALLSLIGRVESGNNYNAYYAHGDNTDNPRLTDMTLAQVLRWQKGYTDEGSYSSAAGRFQIIRKTLKGLVASMNLSLHEVFNEYTQDAMADQLLRGRGLAKYQMREISTNRFCNSLAKEWAALPVTTRIKGRQGFKLEPGQSYYAGDGVNKALVSIAEVKAAVHQIPRVPKR